MKNNSAIADFYFKEKQMRIIYDGRRMLIDDEPIEMLDKPIYTKHYIKIRKKVLEIVSSVVDEFFTNNNNPPNMFIVLRKAMILTGNIDDLMEETNKPDLNRLIYFGIFIRDMSEFTKIAKSFILKPIVKPGESIIPKNALNVMLTDKEHTIHKLEKIKNQFIKTKKITKSNRKLERIEKRISILDELLNHCQLNFPEEFDLTLYEHYAIFGGFSLLNRNRFNSTFFNFADILEVLLFDPINKKDITEIKAAMMALTVKPFPCYIVRSIGDDRFQKLHDLSPLFKVLSIEEYNFTAKTKNIHNKKYVLFLNNQAIIQSMDDFYCFVNSNILQKFRSEIKNPESWNLYFLEYIIKHSRSKMKTKCISLEALSKLLKYELTSDRRKIGRFKNRILELSRFCKGIGYLQRVEVVDHKVTFVFPINLKLDM